MRKVPMPRRRRNNPDPALRPVVSAEKTTPTSEPCRREELLAGSEIPDVQSPMTVQKSSCEAPKPSGCHSEPFAVILIPQSREKDLALPAQGKLREESRSAPSWDGNQGVPRGLDGRKNQSEIPLPRLRDRNDSGATTLEPNLEPLGPALQLLPYQRRWVEDDSALKIVVKARQIGYSFAASIRALLECLKRRTTWIFLSKGERQSRLLMEKVQEHVQSCGILARACESTFFEGTLIKQLEVRFANGSVIYGLPANPDTARGYSGNVTLDEFAFHSDADKIYTALFPTITRGYCLEVISTPNGQQGKFYEIAKAAGLVESGDREIGRSGEQRATEPDGSAVHPITRSPGHAIWSAHCCDIYEASRQGLKIDLQVLRAGC